MRHRRRFLQGQRRGRREGRRIRPADADADGRATVGRQGKARLGQDGYRWARWIGSYVPMAASVESDVEVGGSGWPSHDGTTGLAADCV